MFETDLLMTLDRVASVLEQLRVEWAIGGSVASSVHGEPRSTNDVDIIAKLRPFHVRKFVQALGDDFYVVESVVAEAIDENRSFNVIDQRTVIKVDVFVPPPGPMGEGQLDRRTKAEFDEDLEPGVDRTNSRPGRSAHTSHGRGEGLSPATPVGDHRWDEPRPPGSRS